MPRCKSTWKWINHLEKHDIEVDGLKEKNNEFIRNKRLTLKSWQRLRIEKQKVFTEEVNQIALSADDDKMMQSIDFIEAYAYGTSKDIIQKTEEIKYKNIINQFHRNIWIWKKQRPNM